MKLSSHGVAYMLFLGALAAIPPISTDMALPALGDIARTLDTTASIAGLTLSLFLLGFAVSPMVYGPMSDRYGRRPALLTGLCIFVVGGAIATFAYSVPMILVGRVVQGAGAGAGMTLAFAIVRDQFEGAAAHTRLAAITIVANVAPIIAPTLGSGLLLLGGWRVIYALTLACGVLLVYLVWSGFAETRPERRKDHPLMHTQGNVYKRLLLHPIVRGNTIVNGLGFAWMFAYVAGSPLVLINLLHVSALGYSAIFACTGAGIVAGATLNGRLSRRAYAPHSILVVGIGLALLASVVLLALTLLGAAQLASVVPLLVLATFSFGLVAPSATHGAMGPLPELAGVAGGLLTSVQMMFGAFASSIVVMLFPRFGLLALSATMTIAALLAACVCLPLSRAASTQLAYE